MNFSKKNRETQDFIPYIQLYEFEALLFFSNVGFEFMYHNRLTIEDLNKIRNRYQNPEEINDNPNTAPSKQLISVIESREKRGYDKYIHGVEIAKRIGIETMMNQCPRFGHWVNQIIQKINE